MAIAGSNGQPHPGDGGPPRVERVPSASASGVPPVSGIASSSGVASAAAPGVETPSTAVSSGSAAELRRERVRLAERVAALTWDLGGLAYEMAIRDHYRLDVLARKASELQEADAQLGEVQRLLATAEAGIHGQCRACGAVHSRGAGYCWHCGAPLLQEARPTVLQAEPSAG